MQKFKVRKEHTNKTPQSTDDSGKMKRTKISPSRAHREARAYMFLIGKKRIKENKQRKTETKSNGKIRQKQRIKSGHGGTIIEKKEYLQYFSKSTTHGKEFRTVALAFYNYKKNILYMPIKRSTAERMGKESINYTSDEMIKAFKTAVKRGWDRIYPKHTTVITKPVRSNIGKYILRSEQTRTFIRDNLTDLLINSINEITGHVQIFSPKLKQKTQVGAFSIIRYYNKMIVALFEKELSSNIINFAPWTLADPDNLYNATRLVAKWKEWALRTIPGRFISPYNLETGSHHWMSFIASLEAYYNESFPH